MKTFYKYSNIKKQIRGKYISSINLETKFIEKAEVFTTFLASIITCKN